MATWLRSCRPEVPPVRPASNPSTTAYFDNPIQDKTQDLLGREPFVEGLYKQIAKLPAPDSFVFGLHGSWGEGKTSVLNLLRNYLAQDPSIISIVFNPWYMATERAIIQNFYDTIEQELQKRYLVGTLHRHINRYRDLLSSGMRAVGFGLEIPIHDNPERLRQELEDWLARTGYRLVVIIDDIDRLQPEEILAVFKLAGLSARLRNFVFILSFDEVAIRARLKEAVTFDPAFLEKIVQKPIPLPPAERRDIDRFLLCSDSAGPNAHRSAIDSLLDELNVSAERRKGFYDEIVYFYQRHLVMVFGNLRHAKRYLNSLRATLPPVVDEVNLYDFFLLEVLQVFFPDVYQDIWRCRWFYIVEGGVLQPGPFSPLTDRQKKDTLIREHLETVLQDSRNSEVVRTILAELFPQVAEASKNTSGVSRNRSASARQEKRLTHPECFPKYFLLRVPAKEIPDSAMELLIHHWNSLSVEEVGEKIAEDFRYYQHGEMLSEFFRKLGLFNQAILPAHVPTLIGVLYKDASNFSRYAKQRLSLSYGADRLIWTLLQGLDTKVAQLLLEEIISSAVSIPFIVGIALDCQGGSADSFFPNNDRSPIRRLAAARLYKHLVEEKRDVFIELPDDWGFVLYQWGTDWMTQANENRGVVQSYMLDLLDSKPEYLGKLFFNFDRGWTSSKEPNFHWDEFVRIYDPNVFAVRLTRYGDFAFSNPEEREAAERFLLMYELKRNTEAQTQEGAL